MAFRTSMKNTPTIPPNTTDKASISDTLGETFLGTDGRLKESMSSPFSAEAIYLSIARIV